MTKNLLALCCIVTTAAACESSNARPAEPTVETGGAKIVTPHGAITPGPTFSENIYAAPAPAAELPPEFAPTEPEPWTSSELQGMVTEAWFTEGTTPNATSLGPGLDAFLITTAGPVTNEATKQESRVSLLLVSGRKSIVAELDKHTEELSGDPAPVGQVMAMPPFPAGHTFDPEADANFDAPPFRGKGRPLAIANVANHAGDKFAYLLVQDKDTLVVWFAEYVYEEYTSTKWKKQLTVRLAPGANVVAPSFKDM
jgi:hypothetical protein